MATQARSKRKTSSPQDGLCKEVTKIARTISKAWKRAQIGHRSEYSIERMLAFGDYYERTSNMRASMICFIAPIPALVIVLVIDCIRLRTSSDGWKANYAAWVRLFVMMASISFGLVEQIRDLIIHGGISNFGVIKIDLGTASCYVAVSMCVASMWRFPIPFGLVLMVWPYVLIFSSWTIIVIGPKLLVKSSLLRQQIKSQLLIVATEGIVTKQIIAAAAQSLHEHFGPMVVFSVHVYNVYYVAICMESITSILTPVLFVASDSFHVIIALRTIFRQIKTSDLDGYAGQRYFHELPSIVHKVFEGAKPQQTRTKLFRLYTPFPLPLANESRTYSVELEKLANETTDQSAVAVIKSTSKLEINGELSSKRSVIISVRKSSTQKKYIPLMCFSGTKSFPQIKLQSPAYERFDSLKRSNTHKMKSISVQPLPNNPQLLKRRASIVKEVKEQASHSCHRSQIGHRSEYSVERLLAYKDYYERTSFVRVVATCILTPLPALLLALAIDCIPLKTPSSGWKANYGLWIRLFVTMAAISRGLVAQIKENTAPGTMSNMGAFIVALGTACGGSVPALRISAPFPLSLSYVSQQFIEELKNVQQHRLGSKVVAPSSYFHTPNRQPEKSSEKISNSHRSAVPTIRLLKQQPVVPTTSVQLLQTKGMQLTKIDWQTIQKLPSFTALARNSNGKMMISLVTEVSLKHTEKTVQDGLQTLFHSEYVLMAEYIEFILPMLYAVYLTAIFHLPVGEYYPHTTKLTTTKLTSAVCSILTFSAVELVDFGALLVLLRRKFGFSPLEIQPDRSTTLSESGHHGARERCVSRLREPYVTVLSFYKRIADSWHRAQIGNQQQYSVERALAFCEYCHKTSRARVVAVSLLTPAPAFIVMLLIECLPLKDPQEGWKVNKVMWVRMLISSVFVAGGIVFLAKTLISEASISNARAVSIAIMSAMCYTGIGILLAVMWKYPVPYGLVLMVSPFVTIIMTLFLLSIDSEALKTNRKLQKQLVGHTIGLSATTVLVVAYPTFNAVFLQLNDVQQAMFTFVLPVIKFTAKQITARVSAHIQDFLGVTIVFSVDLFNVLYVVICMQTARSLLTTVLVMSLDALHIVFALRNIYYHTKANTVNPEQEGVNCIERILISLRKLTPQIQPYCGSIRLFSPYKLSLSLDSYSPAYQVAFVLETHVVLVQSLLFIWIIFIVQLTLVHGGKNLLPGNSETFDVDSHRIKFFVMQVSTSLFRSNDWIMFLKVPITHSVSTDRRAARQLISQISKPARHFGDDGDLSQILFCRFEDHRPNSCDEDCILVKAVIAIRTTATTCGKNA
ncbi:unnamed protein product [Phytophthora fragariaefolia]|uniref:Unnamed protein product n=1 Tax=Phytophthora fragariaefolia TaxID=1490495 RepID=A0A9W6XLJ4_9STRA|nr:unnamed protein product [Phytophthora fragariaefolia]